MAIDIERTQTYYVTDSTSCPHSPHPFLPNKSANNSHQTIKTARLLPESTPLTPRFSTPPNRRRVPDRDPGFPKQICQHSWISWDQIYLFTSFSHLTPPIFQDFAQQKTSNKHPCMVYLATFTININETHVGIYTIHVDPMGNIPTAACSFKPLPLPLSWRQSSPVLPRYFTEAKPAQNSWSQRERCQKRGFSRGFSWKQLTKKT